MLQRWLLHQWFEKKFSLFVFCLLPLAGLFQILSALRKFCYHKKLFKTHRFNTPVIIIGNISVGGSGKTPLIIALYFLLKKHGYKPGIISRGYGGSYKNLEWVMTDSDPVLVGDEPALIANRTSAPVVVAKKRYMAVEALLKDTDCNIILSDDGMQHYALERDIEIAVVDGKRGFGNGLCLPAGPLREPVSRLRSVNFIIQNGGEPGTYSGSVMTLSAIQLISLADNTQSMDLNILHNAIVHAVAGIGNPDRFFDYLSGLGARVVPHRFPDHHQFSPKDFDFPDGENHLIIMTEKDAIKCRDFATENMWFLPVEARLEQEFEERLLEKIASDIGYF